MVDFSRLGLGSAEEVELLNDFGSRRLLARGEFVERVFGSGLLVPTRVVDDAWRGATGTQGDWGSYWATIPSGITCFTFPCPTLYRFKNGGFTYLPNPACGFGEFCESPEGTCFIADRPGTCQSVPTLCSLAIIPVCGCDGNTYGNDCERQQAQVALDHEGGCSIGTNSCGFVTCGPGMTCCNPLYGICTPPGTVCIQ